MSLVLSHHHLSQQSNPASTHSPLSYQVRLEYLVVYRIYSALLNRIHYPCTGRFHFSQENQGTSLVPVTASLTSKCFSVSTAQHPLHEHCLCHLSHLLRRHRLGLRSYARWADFLFILRLSWLLKPGPWTVITPPIPHSSSKMAPSTSNIKNSGAVHLSCIAIVSNPCRLGTGTNNLALDLHLLIGAIEKTILAHYFNASHLSFTEPHVCSLNVSVSLPLTCLPHTPLTVTTIAYQFWKGPSVEYW